MSITTSIRISTLRINMSINTSVKMRIDTSIKMSINKSMSSVNEGAVSLLGEKLLWCQIKRDLSPSGFLLLYCAIHSKLSNENNKQLSLLYTKDDYTSHLTNKTSSPLFTLRFYHLKI